MAVITFVLDSFTVPSGGKREYISFANGEYGNLNAVRSSPAKRDLLEPFVKALRNENIKVGAYYSLPDWSYPDYTEFTRTKKRYQIQEDPKRWQRFLDYSYGQMKELRDQFSSIKWTPKKSRIKHLEDCLPKIERIGKLSFDAKSELEACKKSRSEKSWLWKRLN